MTTAIIPRTFNDVVIHQRADGYWNATAMCQANRKQWSHYLANQSTREYLDALSGSLGIPRDRLVCTITTGANELRGTWVHRRVALHLAQWCDARFAVLVTGWVEELLTTGRVELVPSAPPAPILQPYIARVAQLREVRRQVPKGHWCIFVEAADLLIDAEHVFTAAGLGMGEYDLLDGSVGLRWAEFRADKPWAGERVHYAHAFPPNDPRGVRQAWAYPMAELAAFREWLHEVYLPCFFPTYLTRKYGPAKLLAARPAFHRLGLSFGQN